MYFNEIKKKYTYVNYFQSWTIIILKNHHAFQYTSANAALVFLNMSLKIGVLFLKAFPHCRFPLQPPYPAPYSTHISTLITTNHFLTPDFTLPSALLYSHQHTSPYPAPYCTHINTLITTNHFLTAHFTLPSTLLYSHQHTSPYPAPYCTHINTLITINGLNSSANFNWRNFYPRLRIQ